MILGLYGDSYCNLNLDQADRQQRGSAWFEELANILGATRINNYGAPGSSVMRCYQTYAKTKHLNDFNVFVIPVLDRIYSEPLENLFKDIFTNTVSTWYANINNLRLAKEKFSKYGTKKLSKFEIEKINKILDSVVVYHEYWKSDAEDLLLNKTFALDLINKLEKTVFLYTDPMLFDDENDFTLLSLSKWEMIEAGWIKKYHNNNIHYGTIKDGKFFADARICHLTQENNLILANKVKETIDRKENVVRLRLSDYVLPSRPIEFYVKWLPL